MKRRRHVQPAWCRTLRVGDVLTNGTDYRAVRRLSWHDDGRLRCVDFAIRRVSWTKRCTTTLDWNDLRIMGYRPAGYRVRFTRPIDRAIQRAMELPSKDPRSKFPTAWDVVTFRAL